METVWMIAIIAIAIAAIILMVNILDKLGKIQYVLCEDSHVHGIHMNLSSIHEDLSNLNEKTGLIIKSLRNAGIIVDSSEVLDIKKIATLWNEGREYKYATNFGADLNSWSEDGIKKKIDILALENEVKIKWRS